MKIATWSVNSVNRILPLIRHWSRRRQPAVVALQKNRISSKRWDGFPKEAIKEVGHRVEDLLADRNSPALPYWPGSAFWKAKDAANWKLCSGDWRGARRMAGYSRWMQACSKLRPSTRPTPHAGTAQGSRRDAPLKPRSVGFGA